MRRIPVITKDRVSGYRLASREDLDRRLATVATVIEGREGCITDLEARSIFGLKDNAGVVWVQSETGRSPARTASSSSHASPGL